MTERYLDTDAGAPITKSRSRREPPPAENERAVLDNMKRVAAIKRRDAEESMLREVVFAPVKAGALGGRRYDTAVNESTQGISTESFDDYADRLIKCEDNLSDRVFPGKK